MVANQFEVARKRAEQQSRAGLQQQQEALKRRFASMGAVSSGARMKAEQVAQEKAQEQLQGAFEGIGAAEQQEKQRLDEIEQQRQFAKQEREAAQQFAAAEREAGQGFASKQAELGRQFSIQERQAQESFQAGQADKNREFQERVQAFAESQAGKEYDLALQQFMMDKDTTEFEKRFKIAQGRREGIRVEEVLPTGEPVSQQMASPQTQEALMQSYLDMVKSAGPYANKSEREAQQNLLRTLSPESAAKAGKEGNKWLRRQQALRGSSSMFRF